MSTRAYANIENNRTDLSMKKLEQIAEIFECSPQYILTYKSSKKEFYNYFHNYPENKGVNIMHQNIETSVGSMLSNKEKIYELQQQLLESEQKRIALLEAVLKKNNIDF